MTAFGGLGRTAGILEVKLTFLSKVREMPVERVAVPPVPPVSEFGEAERLSDPSPGGLWA
jgi:hypothetical protein